jgi:uncharacterized secreted protein with C-terminal beta-propeller domain
MAIRSNRSLVLLLSVSALAVACAPSLLGRVPKSSAGPGKLISTATAVAMPAAETRVIADPSESQLTEVRLVPSSCETHARGTDAAIKQMRAEVDAEYKQWHAAQPECWAEDRERERWRKSGEMFGAGGLGLSGAGEGGGGRGEGIGLGSVGTIGHGSGVAAATSMSRTNNQVAGVDEADIVKTDGRYVYVVANGALRIMEALNPRIVSITRLTGVVRELLVEGDRAIVFTSSRAGTERCTYGYDCAVAGDGSSTRIDTFDISDRASPKALRKIELTGSLIASRRIGKTVHAVVSDGDDADKQYATWPDDMESCGVPEAIVRAKFAALKLKNERILRAHASLPSMKVRGITTLLCAGLLETAFDQSHTFTSLISFDMHEADAPVTTATVRSRPGTVFASENALYISAHRRWQPNSRWYSLYEDAKEVSEIHKFHIGSSPRETRYVGSGVVPGHVLNQFAMDEWNGHLRIATTLGKVPNPKVESAVSILKEGAGGNLVRVGALEHLARGEDLRAIRFDDDRGYLVTFKKTDPLFTLDLQDPKHPRVLGELKIPGFSTYLHRIDKTHLLSIGFDANDHGDFAFFDGILLQLFDVSTPTEPKLIHKEKIGTRGSSSAAATDHLAFNYFADKGLLALPMTVCEGGADGRNGDTLSFAGLLVYRVGVGKGFERLGGVAHGKEGSSCNTWWSKANSTVKRSIFLDDLVYSVALDRIKVQRMNAFGVDVADVSLQQ